MALLPTVAHLRYNSLFLMGTTSAHYLSVAPLIRHRVAGAYLRIIVLSTCVSILYHACLESGVIVVGLDYLLAMVWFFYNVLFGLVTGNFVRILVCDGVIVALNLCIPYDKNYYLVHGVWHLASAGKAYYVSHLIGSYYNERLTGPTGPVASYV